MVARLGNSENEKIINYLKIKKTRKRWSGFVFKIYTLLYIVFLIFFINQQEKFVLNSDTIWALVGFAALFYSQWFLAGYIYGTGYAWGLFWYQNRNANEEYTEGQYKKEMDKRDKDIVDAYIIGVSDLASARMAGYVVADAGGIFITLIVGYIIGWICFIANIVDIIKIRRIIKKSKKAK